MVHDDSKEKVPSGEGAFSQFDIVAHSADPENDVPYTQTYKDHSTEVRNRALKCFDEIVKYLNLEDETIKTLRDILKMTAEHHDLGKIDPLAQEVIKGGHKKKMLNHVDAGAASMLRKYEKTDDPNFLIAAMLIDAHHVGLLNKVLNEDRKEGEKRRFTSFLQAAMYPEEHLRDNKKVMEKYAYYESVLVDADETVSHYVNRTLDKLLKIHKKCVHDGTDTLNPIEIAFRHHPMLLRMLLSCLVEGDHWDTSRHYGGIAPDVVTLPMRAEERVSLHMEKYNLGSYFDKPKTKMEKKKNKVRQLIHRDCELVDLSSDFYGIYAYPSFGKTLSGSFLGARLCMHLGMRGIVYMAPYNNILTQNIKDFENFFVGDNEKKGEVIGEHYQDASYYERANSDGMNYKLLKHYSTLWNCPLEVVSVVQFFETLASNYPSKVRKLHQIAGRVIIIDEFHTAVPIKMLRQTLIWLKYLTEFMGCKVIFMSGSPVKFWEIGLLKSCDIKVKEVLSKESTIEMDAIEEGRVRYLKIKKPFDSLEKLANRIMRSAGPRVVVFNTVFTASVFANYIRLQYGKDKVEHLSTTLTPKDRKIKYEHIVDRLENKKEDKDWCLVATSCIETGVNFSFKTGYRENSCFLSTKQLGGRVNRGNEYRGCRIVYVFDLDHAGMGLTNNPAFNASIKVQNGLFEEGKIGYNYCTEAIRRELIERNVIEKSLQAIESGEEDLCLGTVADLYKIIARAYKSVIIDQDIANRVNNEEVVQHWELAENSVQIFFTKLDRIEYQKNIDFLNEDSIPNDKYREAKIKAPKEFNIWTGEYDPDLLGYMKGILRDMNYNVD